MDANTKLEASLERDIKRFEAMAEVAAAGFEAVLARPDQFSKQETASQVYERSVAAVGLLSRWGSRSPLLERFRAGHENWEALSMADYPPDRFDGAVDAVISCGSLHGILEVIEEIDSICAGCTFIGKAEEVRSGVDLATDAIKAWPELFAPLRGTARDVLAHRPPLENDPALDLWRALAA